MKTTILLHLRAILICSSILAFPLAAQPQNCQPPVALPVATEPNIFTEQQEIFLGDAVAEHIQKNYHVIEDTEVTEYLARLGEGLTRQLPLNNLRFQFVLVDLPDANAFVLPGGRIYVSRKLVAAAQSDDELAGVIAHELGHLVAHESAIETTRTFREVLGVTSVGDRRDIFEKYNRLIESLKLKPDAVKVREREKGQLAADQAGMFALVRAGYDPSAIVRFWDRIAETRGKKGNWLSDLFGTTRPEERRLREMSRATDAIPANCRQSVAANHGEQFKQWQAAVVSYTGLGRKESLHALVSKLQLSPPLRSDIVHLKFSPDGKYVLAQDDSGINVLSREPFAPLFRINTFDDTYYANFTPDSQSVVFYSDNLRVERWSVAEQKLVDVKELVIRKGCFQTRLSPDGRFLACLDPDFGLGLLNVASGELVWQKKEFYWPNYLDYFLVVAAASLRGADSPDLNVPLINLAFSPDGRYFAAAYHGRKYKALYVDDIAEAVDLNTLDRVSLPDSLKKVLSGGFVFFGNDRVVAINREDAKKSGIYSFPAGDVVQELELWRKGMTPATRGDYLLVRPIKDYPLGVLDLKTRTITKANERAALDIFDDVFVAERRNGEIGLYRVAKNEIVASTLPSEVSLGRLRVGELSSDLKWLALSGRSRGGVWNLAKGEAVLTLRGFEGGYLSDDGHLFADFPKYDAAERNIARFNLETGLVAQGAKIEARSARQIGEYLVTIKSAKAGATTTAEKENERVDYSKNVILDLFDARTMTLLWSKAYPKEAPRAWIAHRSGTVALVWNLKDEAARMELKSDARLSQQLQTMKEKEGDYLVKILNARDGRELGKLLIETGKGSFRLANVFAADDWVVVTDTENRVLLYSLATGQLKGRVFGGYATISTAKNLLCVENESGKLAVYDLKNMERREEFVFSSPISMVSFTPDGQRLFVLTASQTAYVFDLSAAPSARGQAAHRELPSNAGQR